MTSRFVLNETSFFGWGCRSELVNQIKSRGLKRALVVTDETLLKNDVANLVISLLDKAKLDYDIFSDVKPNPTIKNVKHGLRELRKNHNDYIIAIGGGSVIDCAKAMGIVLNNNEFKDVKSLEGVKNTKNPSLPIIALPTTAGTAAEVTINYVITDEDMKSKLVCIDPHCIPIVAIVDTELMSYMPAGLVAATGMDALTHAMECYITKGHNDMTDMYALKAMKMIYSNIEKAVIKDRDAMEQMAKAQYIAGMGFSNAGLGIVHSMAHQLGAIYDTPHGIANAILLPYVLEYNGEVCSERFIDMGKAFGLKMDGLEGKEAVNKVVTAIKELNYRLNIPKRIRDVGAKKEDISLLAYKALYDPCTGGNPREMDIKDFEALFERVF